MLGYVVGILFAIVIVERCLFKLPNWSKGRTIRNQTVKTYSNGWHSVSPLPKREPVGIIIERPQT